MTIQINIQAENAAELEQQLTELARGYGGMAETVDEIDTNGLLDIVRERLAADGMKVIVQAATGGSEDAADKSAPSDGSTEDEEPAKPKAKRKTKAQKAAEKEAEDSEPEGADAEEGADDEDDILGLGPKTEPENTPTMDQSFDLLKDLYHNGSAKQQKAVKKLLGTYKVKTFSEIDESRAQELWDDVNKIKGK